jgi:hypothetical protein
MLDSEQHIDAPDSLQRDRRDRGCLLATPGIDGNIGQLEELPPCVRQHSADVIGPGKRDGL